MVPTFPDVVVNATWISAVAGTLLTLLASYVPGFNKWFASLSPSAKQLCMLVAIAVVTAVVAVLTFTDVWPNTIPPTKNGVIGLVLVFIETVIANQAVYKVLPQTHSVTVANEESRVKAISRAQAVVRARKP